MPDQIPPANYHALLIGVDGYRRAALGGCVNDIDAVERVLLSAGMGAVSERMRIRRLASPVSGASRNAATAPPATLDNVRTALTALGSPEVSAGDRVFIYYAGHGARVPVTGASGRRFHREALVPVDYDADPQQPRLLYDYELNALLQKIVARTRSVTLVLDCCHSAGATREGAASRDRQPRYIDLSNLPALPDPAPASRGNAEVPPRRSVPSRTVTSLPRAWPTSWRRRNAGRISHAAACSPARSLQRWNPLRPAISPR